MAVEVAFSDHFGHLIPGLVIQEQSAKQAGFGFDRVGWDSEIFEFNAMGTGSGYGDCITVLGLLGPCCGGGGSNGEPEIEWLEK